MVKVELDLSEDLIVQLALLSIERDITINQLIQDILKEYIEKHERS